MVPSEQELSIDNKGLARRKASKKKASKKWSENNPEKKIESQKKWIEKNREKVNQNGKKWRANNSEYGRWYSLKWRYGITKCEYFTMLEAQHGCCLVCEKSMSYKDFHVDHNHNTGVVRGLLCNNCNVLLGHASDDVKILSNAIEYLNHRL